MSASAVRVRRNAYVDSITLLQVSADVLALPGVDNAALVMATDLNRDVLSQSGLLIGEATTAGPNDLVIAVHADSEETAESSLATAESLLTHRRGAGPASGPGDDAVAPPPRSIRSAQRQHQDANLAIVSVPGQYAASEAFQALAAGMHVFLFSDNVSLEDEISLKQEATRRDLLVMGPDCGTALIDGIGLGFSNAVRRGDIGIIAASGTGLQEVSCLLDSAGAGVSHAIGTGGRDLSREVGGLTTLKALDLLARDPDTHTIVLISKPPASEVAERVLDAAVATGKPIVACLLGAEIGPRPGVEMARNLYQAARLAAGPDATWAGITADDLPRGRWRPDQRLVRGLYCGGTLLDEAVHALGDTVSHEMTDFGDDEYTRGRAHPMIDPTLRNAALAHSGADSRVAIVLLDVIIGRGSHADPAGAAVPAIRQALETARANGRHLLFLAHVVGTTADPQDRARQEATLRAAGVHVLGSNYHAAVGASLLLEEVTAA